MINNSAGLVDRKIAYPFGWKGVYPQRTQTKMKRSFEALSREFVGKDTIVKLLNSLEDTSVRNMLLKVVYLTSASLAVHSNVIE